MSKMQLRKRSNSRLRHRHTLAGAALVALAFGAAPAIAQDASAQEEEETSRNSDSLLGDIVVTARKLNEGERAQDVPVAITALGGEQLEALNFRSLSDLSVAAPNVTLDRNGNSRSYANFTIRGLGSNSSIVSVEPAVGVFVNGVYQGIPAGNIVDNFDVSNVQILRGPQGTLFGRNVTAGAVLIETKRPTGGTSGEFIASIETGPEYNIAGAVQTDVVEDVLALRVAASYRKDEGWFTNNFDNSSFGKSKSWFVRPTLVFSPGDAVEMTFIGEFGKTSGDGPAEQGFNLIGTGDGYALNLDNRGFANSKWHSITQETVIDVADNATVTNVFGYRRYQSEGSSDIDGGPNPLFHSNAFSKQSQISNELRFAGKFGNLDLTVGGFIFFQDILLIEDRDPFAGRPQGGGGMQDQSSYGIFGQGIYHITEQLSLTAGLRYSYETKDATVARRVIRGCIVATRTCDFSNPTIRDGRSWNSLSPRLGIQFEPTKNLLFYASYAEATRSGGYNLRLAAATDPGIFDQEDVQTFELGAKIDAFDRKLRFNAAGFHNKFKNLQRQVNLPIVLPGGATDIVQTLSNGADAKSSGFEAELIVSPIDGIEFLGNVAYTDMKYTNILFDLNNDRVVDDADYALKTPRVTPWSFGGGIIARHEFAGGSQLRGQLIYAYRSGAAADDANTVFFPNRNDLRANISYIFPNENIEISVYGRNLLDEVPDSGAKLLLPTFPSRGFRAIDEGRSYGASVRFKF